MLTEEDKIEMTTIALKSNIMENYRFSLVFALNIMKINDNEKYLNWSSAAHRKFEKDGTTTMIEDLSAIVDSRYDLYKSEKYEEEKYDADWESLEKKFIENIRIS